MSESQLQPHLRPHHLSAISSQQSFQHKKQISIESRVEQSISSIKEEEEEDDERWEGERKGKEGVYDGTLKRIDSISKVSVVISSAGDVGNQETHSEVDTLDPINWSTTKKTLTYLSLLLLTAITASLKLLLVPFTSSLSTKLEMAYFSTNAALTGIPILVGVVISLFAAVVGKVVGRRALLLFGATTMFVGTVWNLFVRRDRYPDVLAARVFHGVGWGLVEGVLLQSMCGLFTGNKQQFHQNIFLGVEVFFTWSSPILSGYLSSFSKETDSSQATRNLGDFRRVFFPLVIAQSISLLLLVLFTPETVYCPHHQSSTSLPAPITTPTLDSKANTSTGNKKLAVNTLQTTISSSSNNFPPSPSSTSSFNHKIRSYIQTLRCHKPQCTAQRMAWTTPLKALIAPSTILRTLLIAPLSAAAFGIASIIAFLFQNLSARSVGEMFVLPAALTLFICCVALSISIFRTRQMFSRATDGFSTTKTSKLRPFRLSGRRLSGGGLEDSKTDLDLEQQKTSTSTSISDLGVRGQRRCESRPLKGAAITLLILTGGISTLFFGCYVCKRFSVQIWDFAQIVPVDSVAGMKTGDVVGMESVEMWWIVSALFALPVFASVGLRFLSMPSSVSSSSNTIHELRQIDKTDLKAVTAQSETSSLSIRVQEGKTHHHHLLILSATNFYTHLLEGIFVLAFPIWIGDGITNIGNGNGSANHGSGSGIGELEIVTGLKTLTIAVAIVVGIVSGASAVGVVFGGEGLWKRDGEMIGVSDCVGLREGV